MSLFVDTSILYAAADSSDRSNARSKAILRSGETLVTSESLLSERCCGRKSPRRHTKWKCRQIGSYRESASDVEVSCVWNERPRRSWNPSGSQYLSRPSFRGRKYGLRELLFQDEQDHVRLDGGNILRETPRDHWRAGAHGAASQFQG